MAGLRSPRFLAGHQQKLLILVSLVILGMTAGVRELWVWPERDGDYSATVVEVPKGVSLGALTAMLEQRGLINRPLLFRLYGRVSG